MAKKKILFILHNKAQCGVYEFGKNIAALLQHSCQYEFIKMECASLADLHNAIEQNKPAAIIYNYHPSVFPWITTKIAPKIFRNNLASISIPQVGIIHEITQQIADTATNYKKKFIPGKIDRLSNSLFDYYIAADPTLLLKNPLVYKTGRLILTYENNFPVPSQITIGSFGFGTPKKGFEKIIQEVQKEFDEAIIRFNIPAADFGDKNGINAKIIEENCRALINKPGIKLIVSHNFLSDTEVLDFLAQNTINIFLYEDTGNRGLSSTIDNAMAVQRPIAVSDSIMFRHIHQAKPSVCIKENSIKTIIQNGFTPLKKYYNEWSPENLLWEYERILNNIFSKQHKIVKTRMGIKKTMQSKVNRFLSIPDKTFTWLRNSEKAHGDDMSVDHSIQYHPIVIPSGISLNRILDNDARKLYKLAVDALFRLVPVTMAKKIPEANVQQGFVFDTVQRFIPQYRNPKILCVGSYEDTASMGLLKMGYEIDEIDPMLNYYLQEYYTKPTTIKHSYDIIFSTSVIEHDPDDESFIKCIDGLLAPGAVAIITCDFKEGWKQGEPKPEVDARFYTKRDLSDRLLSLLNNCTLVDQPQWDCEEPDFNYLGKYQYTFATFVIKKNQ